MVEGKFSLLKVLLYAYHIKRYQLPVLIRRVGPDLGFRANIRGSILATRTFPFLYWFKF